MKRRKSKNLLPIILFAAVIVLSIGGLILAQVLRRASIENPSDYATQDDIPRLTVDEAYQAFTSGEAVLVDTRTVTQFEAGHAEGAINIPLDQIDSALAEMDPEAWYITYCT